jgi:hypothetical protein
MTETFQLRRMVLLNAGTKKHVPSGRITAIDPRGGAAVLGENGVGKTTTLRILPLFFGHLPSQLVAAGQGQEAMVRFILPTNESAIVLEYPYDLTLCKARKHFKWLRQYDHHGRQPLVLPQPARVDAEFSVLQSRGCSALHRATKAPPNSAGLFLGWNSPGGGKQALLKIFLAVST